MDIEKEYECEDCPYYRKKYSEKLGGVCGSLYIYIKSNSMGLRKRRGKL